MSLLILNAQGVHIGKIFITAKQLYTLRPNAPRLPAGMAVIYHQPGVITYVSDGSRQQRYTGKLDALDALLADERRLATELAELPPEEDENDEDIPPEPTLEEFKLMTTVGIDVDAENLRLQVLTPGSGQAMVYLMKAEEARYYLSTHNDEKPPADETFLFLNAELGITAETLYGVAQTIVLMEGAWLRFGAAIESERLSAKKLVGEAQTKEEVEKIRSVIIWPPVPEA